MIQIRICLGSSCFSRGNRSMVKIVKDYLKAHQLEDIVDFRGGHCFGTCHMGPFIEINGTIHEKLDEQILLKLLDETFNRQKR
ncbi:MAG: NAD(P)H-dependent oxidoreductase subunit E [Bacteroidales bacterium]